MSGSPVSRKSILSGGGFPCQDVSQAARGRNSGLAGARSGLWFEYRRVVDEMRPRVVVVENVFTGKARWLPTVRRDMHLLGYRTRAFRIDARDVGAPHSRARIFVVAYPNEDGQSAFAINGEMARAASSTEIGGHWRNAFAGSFRMDDGIPHGMDRVEALGDAIVPQCAELVGRVISSMGLS
jgi:DNA (cytosine-5)-methyltransferase 1